jgi:hypothetical protein
MKNLIFSDSKGSGIGRQCFPQTLLNRERGSLNFLLKRHPFPKRTVCTQRGGGAMENYVTWGLLFQYTMVLLAVVTAVITVINHNNKKK